MKIKIITFLIALLTISCNNERLIELPKVSQVKITHITDHSPIYIFYNEENTTAELNRSNLITSTHWIFHIDKRNSFSKVASHLHFMQKKKANPMNPHSNPNSRNYFSVANTDPHQLGFIDFSETQFLPFLQENQRLSSENIPIITIKNGEFYNGEAKIDIKSLTFSRNEGDFWHISQEISFQEFISVYDKLLKENIIPKTILF